MPKKIKVEPKEEPKLNIVLESSLVEPLTLHADFGRADLNAAFQKVEDKINELIRKK